MQFPFQISLCCCLSLPCLSSLAGEWSAQDLSVVNTPWISIPSHSSFSSRLFTRTCWLFVCCYPWFPKLVLRGTPSVPNMWAQRWVITPDGQQLKPSFDWFAMCHRVSDSTELHLEVKARGMKPRLCCRTKTFCNGGCWLREKCAWTESDGADAAKTWLERKV